MTLPRGFDPPHSKNKNELEEKIKELEKKLAKLSIQNDYFQAVARQLPTDDDRVTKIYEKEYPKYLKRLDSLQENDSTDPNKIKKNTQSVGTKGIKTKYLLIGGIVTLAIIWLGLHMNEYETLTDTTVITETSQPLSPPPNKASPALCKKAYELGPNDWWKKHCQ